MLAASVQNAVRAGVLVCSALAACVSLPARSAPVISLVPDGQSRQARAPADFYVFAPAVSGEEADVEVLTLRFTSATTLIRIASTSRDFVIEQGGSCVAGRAFAFGDTCSLRMRFVPQGAGNRLGRLTIEHTADTGTPAGIGLGGNGYAPVVSFTPAIINTVPGSYVSGAGTISNATSLAVDGGDILYIADTGNDRMKEVDSSGNLVQTALNPIATPASLAVDSFGIIYTANTHGSTYYFSIFYPWGSQTAYGYAYTSSNCTASAPCAFSAVGMNYPANMSIDANNNLFFEEGTAGAAEMPVGSISGGSGTLNLWHLSDQFAYSSGSPGSFAADAFGNIYTYYKFSTSTCYILTESLYNAEYLPSATRVAGGVACGYSGDGGPAADAEISTSVGQIAFDLAGNMYFADNGNQRVRRVDNASGQINTIAGNGAAGYSGDGGAATSASLNSPTGVAVNSQGAVYIISGDGASAQVIRKVGPDGILAFNSQLVGSTSSPLTVTVANTGNSALQLTGVVLTGTNAADFSIDPNTTNCNLTAGAILGARQSCKIGVVFKLAASETGARSANLVLLDNSVTGQNIVSLTGTGVATNDRIFASNFGG